jgi:hypothetical protein
MSDLRTRLDEIAGPAVAPSTSTVDADLSRGRRALRRRRVAHIAARSSFAAAAVLAVALAIPAVFTGGSSTGGSSTSVATGGVSSRLPTQLVAYTGKQPAGFTLDQVPEGWQVQGGDQVSLTLAPTNAPNKDGSCAGKICIFLQKSLPPDVPRKDVRVGDKPGVLATMKGGSSQPGTLFVKQPSGAYLTIQLWDGLNWTEKDLIQFATGVHVNDGAGLTAG